MCNWWAWVESARKIERKREKATHPRSFHRFYNILFHAVASIRYIFSFGSSIPVHSQVLSTFYFAGCTYNFFFFFAVGAGYNAYGICRLTCILPYVCITLLPFSSHPSTLLLFFLFLELGNFFFSLSLSFTPTFTLCLSFSSPFPVFLICYDAFLLVPFLII